MSDCRTCEHRDLAATVAPCKECHRGLGTDPSVIHWAARAGGHHPAVKGQDMLMNFAPAQPAGRKDDGGKLDLTLFFDDLPHAVEAVTEVLQWATTKKKPAPYDRGSWQQVSDFQRRYRAAMLRHAINKAKAMKGVDAPTGEPTDQETGLMELAHIATDALFMLEMAVRKSKGLAVPEGA